jgi:pimeloyl-ACP methyl ester carboxylesterase
LVIGTVSQMREETFRAAVQAIVGFEARDLLPQYDVPVLCVAGELDTTAAPAVMEKMAAKIAHAQYLCHSGVGHFAWAEQSDVFNGALLDFLARRFSAN